MASSSSHDVFDDDCSSGEDSLLLESLFNPPAPTLRAPVSCASNGSNGGETKSETIVILEAAQGNTAQQTAWSNSPSLCDYFSMLAMELNTDCMIMVVVVDNAHIPLLGAEYLLADEDACNEAFSRSLSAINTVSFPPPFLIMAEGRGVSSSRWDSTVQIICRGGNGNSRRLVNQAESDLGPQKPGRTCDDYETEAQSIDKTTHHRFTARNIKSPVPLKKKPRGRRGPIVPCTSRTSTPAELCNKPYNAPGPSKSLDSTSRWLRELPRREDVKPIPPRPRLVRRRSPDRRYSSEDLDDHVYVTEHERQKQEQFRPDTSEWTAWFDKMASMTSALHHDDQSCDLNPAADDGLMNETNETVHHKTAFKSNLETSNLKQSYVAASWGEGTSNDRSSSFFRSRQANPSSLVNQLLIIDNGSPTDPYPKVIHSPASHLKSELSTKKNIDLMGHGSLTELFDNKEDPDVMSPSSHPLRGTNTNTVSKWLARA